MFVIDSQIHLWEPDSPERPWPRDRDDVVDPRNIPIPPPDMLRLMDDAGVDRAVIVPPNWAGDDNTLALEWCREYPGRFAVMGRFDLWSVGPDELETWLDEPDMLGIRMSFSGYRGLDWLDVDTFPWFWAATERLGIPVMILCQGLGGRLRPIVERHPDLRLILDHLALSSPPKVDEGRKRDEEVVFGTTFEDVLALADYPNAYVKFSALPVYARADYPYSWMNPFLRRAFEAYGARRVMWGSDITRVRKLPNPPTYEQTLDHVRSLEFLNDEDKEWVLGRTAATVLNWPVPAGTWRFD